MSYSEYPYQLSDNEILILHDVESGDRRYVPVRSILEWYAVSRPDGFSYTHIRLDNGSLNVRESPTGIFERKLMWSDVHPEQAEDQQ